MTMRVIALCVTFASVAGMTAQSQNFTLQQALSAPFASWSPGVSTNATWPSGRVTTPVMRVRVV